MEIQNNKPLLAATVVIIVISAMCLDSLLGTTLYLNAARRGETNTFDVSASFTALDANGTAMGGATVSCSGSGGFSKDGTTDSQGKWSFTEAVTLSSGDCPQKNIERSCYAKKGDVRTTTASGSVGLVCWSGTSTSTADPTSTNTVTPACASGCSEVAGAVGGVCAPAGVIGPRCCGDVESAYANQVACSSGQVVTFISSSAISNYQCGGNNGCHCYKLDTCDHGCKSGKCIVQTACQAQGVTGHVACSTMNKACVSSTCGGGCDDFPTADGPCGCVATCD